MSLHKKKKIKKRQSVADGPAVEQPMSRKRMGCKRFLVKWFVIFMVCIVGVLIIVPAIIYAAQPDYYKILIIGSDQRGTERARSDAIMILSVPKKRDDPFSIIMIPRDTKIEHEEKGLQKLTHFYAMWEDEDEYLGNIDFTREVIEDLLDVKLDGTIEVTFDSFIEIVDMVGGVDTESEGHLDGAAAKELVHNRFNKAEGDFGRAAAQREVLRNLMSRMKDPVAAQQMYEYFKNTDRARLNINRTSAMVFGAAYIIGHRGDTSIGEVEEVVLPVSGQRIYTASAGKELSYQVVDEDELIELVEEYLR